MSVEIDVNGTWYEVYLPMFVWRGLEGTAPGEEIGLETFYYVAERQPIPKLVGFTRGIEREFFKKLITVPKLGPTKALKAMIFSVSTIATWIEDGNARALAHLPGIGNRTAETIVATLRQKVVAEALLRDEGFEELPEVPAGPTLDEVTGDAVAGLMQLGFGRGEAARLVDEITREQALLSVEEVIRAVFQRMQAGR